MCQVSACPLRKRRGSGFTKKDEIDTAVGYFENDAPRMRYHWFRQCGLFVGSGVVESSCNTAIGSMSQA